MTVTRGSEITMVSLPGRRSGDPLKDVDTTSSVRIVELEPNVSRFAHRHPFSEEIMVVASGRGKVWIEGEFTEVAAGDVVTVPIGMAHATVCSEAVKLHCFFPHGDLPGNYEETDIVVRFD
ncbi:MAG: cupin domain-containing protein [Acidimicrobiia bacterium]|nr:cupin domain-containing protein [Acidimicrobiia bacterium]